jgi:TPR repeat protein
MRVLLLAMLMLASSPDLDANASESQCEEPSMRALSLQGVPDDEIAKLWLLHIRCRADEGDANAQLKLGIAYRDGSDGLAMDYAEAARWFQYSAFQGNAMAQLNLGRLYERGDGVTRNNVEAYKWYTLAIAEFDSADCGRLLAIDRRANLLRSMTSDTIGEALELVRSFQKSVTLGH